ncbi:hypothetical protein [Methylocystis echinoides]|jgi:hypothetical protein|uniref:hypothetical protein n=1 Tax=Methylocystis echinoides TaxID=29468 RepID=UPI0034442FB5
MFHVYLIKIAASPVGVVARSPEGFRFYAMARHFTALENLIFDSAEDARAAAMILSESR